MEGLLSPVFANDGRHRYLVSGYNWFSMDPARRVAVIEPLIPRPPVDVAPLRNAFSSMVAKQWDVWLPSAPTGAPLGATYAQSVKARFIAEMYARACYSMLLLSAGGPKLLRLLISPSTAIARPSHCRTGSENECCVLVNNQELMDQI